MLILKMKRLTRHLSCLLAAVLLLSCEQPLARESEMLHLVYTTNLNGSLDDCQCGDDPVGGFTRVLPELERLAGELPNRLVVDAGDFFSSYSLPAANRLMLKLLALAPYDAISPGDQEFVEAAGFIRQVSREENLRLPLLTGNLPAADRSVPEGARFKILTAGPFSIFVLGIVNKKTFDFIVPPAGGIADDAAVLEALADTAAGSDLQVLLYHGERHDAEQLAAQFPWLDVIVLAHQQQKAFSRVRETALVEGGSSGEYIGHLSLRRSAKGWQFENKFIPVTRSLPLHPEAKRLVTAYYQQIGAAAAPQNDAKPPNSGDAQ